MPFSQHGDNSEARIGIYHDIAGSQVNNYFASSKAGAQ